MRLLCPAFCVLTLFTTCMALADSEKQPPPSVDNELVILLRPEPAIGFIGPAASAPPQIVASINAGESPGGLGEVKPSGARLAIKDRVRGRMAKWIEHNWDTPTGRLQRYVVFTYPEETDADEAADVLKDNPNVEGVSRNVKLRLHAIPSDDFVGDGTEDPEDAQWGVHLLNLPAAWDWVTGHSTLGFIDEGLETQHFDLRATHEELGFEVDDGGAFRAHLSRDVLNDNCSVDEMDPADGAFDPTPGHGSHTMGIAAASTDNDLGVAGTCWNCSVMMTKAFPTGSTRETDMASAAQGLDFLTRRGAQSVNMSFGVSDINIAGSFHCGPDSDIPLLCDAIAFADLKDVVMVASSGNDRNKLHPSPEVDYPAADPRTIAVGGLELDPMAGPVLWVKECEHPPFDCGSWIGPSQDLMAAAQDVLSTVYTGFDHIAGRCGDSLFPAAAGLGLCTGTSMSAPFVTGEAGLVRTANPLLDKEEVRDVLTSTASIPGTKDPELGHGIPDAEAAVKKALGTVSGSTLKNRLTPLFAFHSPPPPGAFQAQTHVYTTAPQFGSAFLLEDVRTFNTTGPTVASFGAFPGFCTNVALPDCCPNGQPCCVGQGPECVPKILVDASTQPRASVFIFTNRLPPIQASHPLVPLHRLRYESAISDSCPSPPEDPFSAVRDFAYATSPGELETYFNGALLNGTFKYLLDGIEGYASGPDSDGDGVSDSQELLVYDQSSPNPLLHGYRDPCSNGCPIFADGFESGDTSAW